MINSLASPAAAAGFGLIATTLCYVAHSRRVGTWVPQLPPLVLAFLAGCAVPASVLLVLYPFHNSVDIRAIALYIPLGGIAMLWASVTAIYQATRLVSGSPSREE